jgi:dTDP-4-dehydrorhamnose 3,5-epimerase
MKIYQTSLPEVLILEPQLFPDSRGHFYEMWLEDRHSEAGIAGPFVQDNVSRSVRGTLRGLHFQKPKAQGKLVTVLAGRIFDVAVDIRADSPTFKKWVGLELDGDQPRQLWVPPGFAHGFCVLSESADFLYKCTEYYSPMTEHSVRWDDPDLAIKWPIEFPVLSNKDAAAPLLADVPVLPSCKDLK